MNRFGALVQQISFMEDPLDQQRVLAHYLSETLEPDRAAAIALLHNPPRRGRIQLKKLREIIENKVGPDLFALSHRVVGDMEETMALLWQPASVPAEDHGLRLLNHQAGSKGRCDSATAFFVSTRTSTRMPMTSMTRSERIAQR